MADGGAITTLAALEAFDLPGGVRWQPLGDAVGLTGLAAGVWSQAEAGGELIEDHDETSPGAAPHDEAYLVLAGRATFTLGEEEHDAPAGTVVHAPVGVRRHAVAAEAGTRVLALGGPPGAVPGPSPWAIWQRAYARRDAGDAAGGIVLLRDALAAHPEHPLVRYHLACLLCTAGGDLDEAREHLAAAQAGDPRTVAWAAGDEDLAPLRDPAG